jgi:hypothetical protein
MQELTLSLGLLGDGNTRGEESENQNVHDGNSMREQIEQRSQGLDEFDIFAKSST